MSAFRAWFTGICQLIQNKNDFGPLPLSVVLVNCSDEKHRPCFSPVERRRRAGRLELDSIGEPKLLDRCRVSFALKTTDSHVREAGLRASDSRLVRMEEILGWYADQHLEILSNDPPACVAAQVDFAEGTMGSDADIGVRRAWRVPLLGLPDYQYVRVPDPWFIEIRNVTAATLLLSPLGSSDPAKEIPLRLNESGNFEILFSNHCSQLIHLGLRRPNLHRLELFELDDDFRFHYELLHPATREALEGDGYDAVLPVPDSLIAAFEFADYLPGFPSLPEPPDYVDLGYCSPEDLSKRVVGLFQAAQIEAQGIPAAVVDWRAVFEPNFGVLGSGQGGGNCQGSHGSSRFFGSREVESRAAAVQRVSTDRRGPRAAPLLRAEVRPPKAERPDSPASPQADPTPARRAGREGGTHPPGAGKPSRQPPGRRTRR